MRFGVSSASRLPAFSPSTLNFARIRSSFLPSRPQRLFASQHTLQCFIAQRHLSSLFPTRVAHFSSTTATASSASASASPLSNPSSSGRDGDRGSRDGNEEGSSSSSSSSSSRSSSSSSSWSWLRNNALVRLLINLFERYSSCLDVHPFKTQMLTSAFLFAIGDITAQCYEHSLDMEKAQAKQLKRWQKARAQQAASGAATDSVPSEPPPFVPTEVRINLGRLAACTMFGLCIMGPGGHVWYSWLDRYTAKFYPLRTPKNVALKVFIDTVVFNPIFLVVFFTSVSLMEGLTLNDIGHKLYRDFVPSYAVDCSIWPWIQTCNFRFLAVKYQLLTVNLFCYFDDVFLSYVQHNGMPFIFQWIEDAWIGYIDRDKPKLPPVSDDDDDDVHDRKLEDHHLHRT